MHELSSARQSLGARWRIVSAARRHDAYAGADLLILLPSALACAGSRRASLVSPAWNQFGKPLLGTVDPATDAKRQGSTMRAYGTRLIMFVKMALEI